MSITSKFPAIKPTLLLDFANTEELDPRITFTRASTATYYGTQTAKAEENLLLQSQTFDNAYWTASQGSVSANSTAAPDGSTTADTYTPNTTSSNAHSVFRAITLPSAAHTVSIYAKANGYQYFVINIFDGAHKTTVYDLTGISVTQTASGGTASITDVGNGWRRCVISLTTSAASGFVYFGSVNASTWTYGSNAFAGDGTSGVFLWGAQLEQRSTVTAYTATTTSPITNYIPVLETAASGVARFDHNPVTDESLGLLIEESRTNLFTYSSAFDNAAWPKVNSSITANTIVAPDGALTGDKLVEDTTASSTHLITHSISFTSGTAYTYSIFAKQAEAGRYIQLSFPSAAFTSTLRGTFDLTSGTFQVTASATAAITSVGNGWYKCSITATATATASGTLGIFIANSSAATLAAVTYTGNGYSGIYIWGAQLEAGAFATSYIPTVASQVTRAADTPTITGTNFSSWYNQGEGALYVEAQTVSLAANRGIFAIGDSSLAFGVANTIYSVFEVGLSGRISQVALVGGSSQVSALSPVYTQAANTATKMAQGYKVNDYAITVNAVNPAVDTLALVPAVSGMSIGSLSSGWLNGANFLNGTIKKIAYYPIRVTNTQLQALTS